MALNAVIQFFCRTLLLLILYYQTKFDCKWTSSLENITEIVIFGYISPCCDFVIEDTEPIFLHDTLPHVNTPPYQSLVKTDEQFRTYHSDKIRHMDRRTDRRSDSNTPPSPIYTLGGGGVIKINMYSNLNTLQI